MTVKLRHRKRKWRRLFNSLKSGRSTFKVDAKYVNAGEWVAIDVQFYPGEIIEKEKKDDIDSRTEGGQL